MLSKKAVTEFQAIWKKQFKKDISHEKAEKRGLELLKLMKVIYRPVSKKQNNSQNK